VQRGAVRVDDAEIAWSSIGDGPNTVVMIMGLGGWSGDWGTYFPTQLAKDVRVVLFDNRGTGTSSRAPGPYTLGLLARDAVAVIDQVAGGRAHVLGISMGGMVAQHLALDHPRQVDKLVLVSTHCGGARALLPLPHVIPSLFPTPGTPADVIVRTRLAAIAAPGWAEKNPEVLEERLQSSLRSPTPVRTYRAQIDAIMRSDRYPRLDEIDAPTLVVHGDADALVPYANGELLARRIPDAKLHTLRGVGHLPMWEAPDETARVIVDFLR
jgi:3-oxoadipate enol-lactonase